MNDETIAERLKRLRRGSKPTSPPGLAAEIAEEVAAVEPLASADEPRANSEIPRASKDIPRASSEMLLPDLDRADKSSAAEVDSGIEERTRRQTVFARLLRRKHEGEGAKTRDELVLLPRDLALDPPRDLVRSARGTWARTSLFERAHRHGSFALEDVLSTPCATLAECARDERIAGVNLDSAVFFDTETTGLSGGAGTYVFLVGLGRFTENGFELWQGFLPHPADEKALLEEVAERIAGASAILSFFGKSFDRHRLEDKMRLFGVEPPFAASIHLDLYYPLRRAYRGKFENCRLKTLERELVGVTRADDLPGSFAPAAWFDFLARRPHRLEGVFRHNADDVLSLVTLAAHLGR